MRYRLSPGEGLKVLSRDRKKYVAEMRAFCSKYTKPTGMALFPCGAGKGSGSVDAYGFLQPCLLLRQQELVYNLRTGSLRNALLEFFPKNMQKNAEDTDYLARCARCFLKGLCEQCPAKSWMEHGTLDTPVEYLCEIAHAQARDFGLIEDGEKAWEVKFWEERIKEFSEKD